MPNPTINEVNEDEFVDNIEDGDYIFIMDSEGDLKSVLLPEGHTLYDDTPENVEKVMNVFGISGFQNKTLH
jgi:hypothetical protein